jgi:Deoxyxylulose-5-phosphate synthase
LSGSSSTKRRISPLLGNRRLIKPTDEDHLRSLSEGFKIVITIEEGVITGGGGDGASSWLLENDSQGQIKRKGLPDSFIQHGKRDELLDEIGLEENSIMNTRKL